MFKIVGILKTEFTVKDGTQICGYTFFTEEPMDSNGVGIKTNKFFLSEAKISKFGLDVETLLEREVVVSYNRWGSVSSVVVVR